MPRGKAPPKPPTTGQRKQNIACDQCRHKKIRCLRADKTEMCQQCSHKKTECTSTYIDSLEQAKAKDPKPKPRTRIRKSSSTTFEETEDGTPPKKKRKRSSESNIDASSSMSNALGLSDASGEMDIWNISDFSTFSFGESSAMAMAHSNTLDGGELDPLVGDDLELYSSLLPTHPPMAPLDDSSPLISLNAKDIQHNLIRYLFSPYPVLTPQFGYTDISSISTCEAGVGDEGLYEEDNGALWIEQPSEAHLSLDDDNLKELADEFLESYLKMVNLRNPIHSPSEVRSRFHLPDSTDQGPLPHPLLAVMLAWGARFSESHFIVQDKKELSSRTTGPSGSTRTLNEQKGSRLVRLLIVRAREVVECSKIYRKPTLENAQTLYLLEGLLGEEIYRGERHQGFYANFAMQQARALIQNGSSGPEVTLLMRHLSATGCVRSLAFGTKILPDLVQAMEDEDISSLAATICAWLDDYQVQRPLSHTTLWLRSQTHYNHLCQKIHQLQSQPSNLEQTMKDVISWREAFFIPLCAPQPRRNEMTSSYAIYIFTIDILFHCLWLFILRTVDNETNRNEHGNQDAEEAKVLKVKLGKECDRAALIIAATTAILTERDYIQLDPLIIYHPIIEAGKYLATRGRQEFQACLVGLNKYAIAYPAVLRKAEELRLIYESNRPKENEEVVNNVGGAVNLDDSLEMSRTTSTLSTGSESTLDDSTSSGSTSASNSASELGSLATISESKSSVVDSEPPSASVPDLDLPEFPFTDADNTLFAGDADIWDL